MRSLVKIVLFFTICLLSQTLTAQETEYGHSFSNPSFSGSGEGTALANSIKNSVNYYNGSVNVQIPIMTIQNGDINVPVSLSYNTSGVKVTDIETAVGLGWNYSAGGKITRVVRGLTDEPTTDKERAYLHKWFNWGTLTGSSYNMNLYDLFHRATLERRPTRTGLGNTALEWGLYDLKFWDYVNADTEPDIYYFEIPTGGGMFIMDHNRVCHTIPYQSIKIEYITDQEYFKITDQSGTVYTFGKKWDNKEVVNVKHSNYNSYGISEGSLNQSYTSTWWLENIKTIFNNTVTFSYITGPQYNYKNQEQVRNGDKIIDTSTSDVTITAPRYIKRISTPAYYIDFTYENSSNTLLKTKLSRITMYSNQYYSKMFRDIRLEHSRFNNGALKLDRVKEYWDNGAKQNQLCQFNYNIKYNLPQRTSKDFDHWGYYNGKNNSVYYAQAKQSQGAVTDVTGANRNVSVVHSAANVLNKIEYPNGRYTEFFYEGNSYQGVDRYNNNNSYSIPGPGVRICKVNESDGQQTYTKTYKYYGGVTFAEIPRYHLYAKKSGKGVDSDISVNSSPINNRNANIGGPVIGYSKVVEILPDNSKIEYSFTNASTILNSEYNDIPGTSWLRSRKDSGYSKHEHNADHWAYLTSYPGGYLDVPRPPIPYSPRFWRRGLPTLTEVYDSNGVLVKKTENRYKFLTPKAEIEAYVVEFNRHAKGYHTYKWISEPVVLETSIEYLGKYNLPSTTSIEYDHTTLLPKLKKTSTTEAVHQVRTYTVSDYNIPSVGDRHVNAAYDLKRKGAVGTPIEIIEYKNGKIIGATLNKYGYARTENNVSYYGLVEQMALAINEPIAESAFTKANFNNGVFTYDSRYKPVSYYDAYGPNHTLLTTRSSGGQVTSTIYGYKNTLPIAQVVNACHRYGQHGNQVVHSSFEGYDTFMSPAGIVPPASIQAKTGQCVLASPYDFELLMMEPGTYVFSYWGYDTTKGTNAKWEYVENRIAINESGWKYMKLPASSTYYIDELRVYPENASMVTKTYIPGIGVSSETDANGRTIYYEYNSVGLLSKIYDNNRRLIKKMTYDNLQN